MDKNAELLEKLRLLDTQRVPFFEAKSQLLKAGYSDQEIAHALYSFSYDGKPDTPKPDNPTSAYYVANPEDAKKIGTYILENAKSSGYGRKTAYFLASQYAPGHHARAKYGLQFADEIGFPYFTALFSLIPGFIAIVRFDLPSWVMYVGPGIVALYWLLKMVWQRLRRS